MIDFTSLVSRRSALAVGASGLSIGLIGLSGLRPLPAQNPARGFTFALIGDLGYVPSEEPWLERLHVPSAHGGGLWPGDAFFLNGLSIRR